MTLKTLLLATSAAFALSATAAAASPFDSASVTYGHDSWSYEDSSNDDASWLRADLGFKTFGLNADFGITQGALGEDTQSTVLSFAVGKEINGVEVGAFYDLPLLEGETQDTYHFGAEVAFDYAGFDLNAFAGQGKFDDTESRIYGGAVSRDIGHGFDTGVFYTHESLDDLDLDVSELGMNVGYTVNGLPVDMHVNAYVSEREMDFDFLASEVKAVGFTVTVPLVDGGKAPKGQLRPHQHSSMISTTGFSEGYLEN